MFTSARVHCRPTYRPHKQFQLRGEGSTNSITITLLKPLATFASFCSLCNTCCIVRRRQLSVVYFFSPQIRKRDDHQQHTDAQRAKNVEDSGLLEVDKNNHQHPKAKSPEGRNEFSSPAIAGQGFSIHFSINFSVVELCTRIQFQNLSRSRGLANTCRCS